MNIREKISELHRKLVVSFDEGERLGHVTNVYFEKSSCSIKGVSLSPGLIKSDQEKFVSFNAIQKLGKNVIIISRQSELQNIPQDLEGTSLRELRTTKVVTQHGKHLGELLDVSVLTKSGVISDFILYGAKTLRIDAKKDKISIGPDMIIVPAAYQKRIHKIEVSNQERFVLNAGKTTRNVKESIKSAVLRVTAANKKAPEEPSESTRKLSSGSSDEDSNAYKATATSITKEKSLAATRKKSIAQRPAKKTSARKKAPDK